MYRNANAWDRITLVPAAQHSIGTNVVTFNEYDVQILAGPFGDRAQSCDVTGVWVKKSVIARCGEVSEKSRKRHPMARPH